MDSLSVLIVDDSATDAKLVARELGRTGRPIDFERVETAVAMRAALERRWWDVVISDCSMPKFSARGALALLKEMEVDCPFIIVSGTIGEDAAVDAMRAGAHDYVLKDKLTRLAPAVEREIRCMSGYTDDAAVRNGVMKEAFAYLQKPLTVGTLTRKVRDVLDSRRS